MKQMTVDSIRVSPMNYQRVVILRENDSDRYLPIWIGPAEADAIAVKLQDLNVAQTADPRPALRGHRQAGRLHPPHTGQRPPERHLLRHHHHRRQRRAGRHRLPPQRRRGSGGAGQGAHLRQRVRPRQGGNKAGQGNRQAQPAGRRRPASRAAHRGQGGRTGRYVGLHRLHRLPRPRRFRKQIRALPPGAIRSTETGDSAANQTPAEYCRGRFSFDKTSTRRRKACVRRGDAELNTVVTPV